MNRTRTYGVEIEFHSNRDVDHITTVVKDAVRDLGMTAVARDYYSNETDSTNTTVWVVKRDGSLDPSPFPSTYPHPVEIASPVLNGRKGLKALKAVCAAVKGYAKISRKCGLHVHHAVAEADLTPIAAAWLKAERWFMGALPNSRQDNTYCRTWAAQGARNNFGSFSNIRAWWDNCMWNGRKTSLNYVSWWLRGTVEFRCGAGTYKYAKIKNWVLATQAFIEIAARAPASHFAAADVYQFEEKMEAFNGDSAAAPAATPAKRYTPRTEQIQFVHDMINTGYYTRKEIIREAVNRGFNKNTVGTYISDWQELSTDRHNPFRADKKVVKSTDSCLYWSAKEAVVETVPTESYQADEDHLVAIDWLVNRNEYFATQR